jgi:hypothetical protein
MTIGACTVARGGEVPASVLTYHDDTQRTGWNKGETSLTTANVNSSAFGLLATVSLDSQVDAQPLVVANEDFTGGKTPGTYNVAYVVTENDSLYAIDTATGNVLATRNFGTPVPESALPGGCSNNGQTIGITSTPVIDAAQHTLYLIADTYESGSAVYRIHALNIATLADQIAPVVVTGSHVLKNGTKAALLPNVDRQRAALLEANGTIYAGFASYCDLGANSSRGWILGWAANTLAPLATNEVTDRLATSKSDYFLSSIWMSGAGIAADATGSVYYITGNSDPTSYDGNYDIQESIVRQSADLSKIESLFTPSNESQLDSSDGDFGSGGALLIPYQANAAVHRIAVAAGKDGRLFILNRDSLGGFSPSGNNVLGTVSIGGCWCAQSFFVGPDKIPRVATSGGSSLGIWQLKTEPGVSLTQQDTSASLSTGQDPGFFTTISSNDTKAGSAIVWAVSRPTSQSSPNVLLYAFNAANAATLFSVTAGTWPNTSADAMIVPTVANGKVLVASYGQLAIFGLLPPGALARTAVLVRGPHPAPLAANAHEIYGRIASVSDDRMLVLTRSGRELAIDVAAAKRADAAIELQAGKFVFVRATSGPGGLIATSVLRAKNSPALWAPDR